MFWEHHVFNYCYICNITFFHPLSNGNFMSDDMIMLCLQDASCKVNETVSFVVEFEGSAPAEVNWFRNNVKISNSDGLEVKVTDYPS